MLTPYDQLITNILVGGTTGAFAAWIKSRASQRDTVAKIVDSQIKTILNEEARIREEMRKQIEASNLRSESQQKQIESQQAQITELKGIVQTLQSSLDVEREKREQADVYTAVAHARAEKAEKELAVAQVEIARLKYSERQSQERIRTLEAQAADLKREIADLKKQAIGDDGQQS